ncbi:MAG: HlyC/CorC family transporter [Magnetovibrio sp.]|nr:HlyC/CorC family transporter [Magnetovibrio sp.]
MRFGNGETARDALEDLIDEAETGEGSLGANERQLLANILDLQGQTIADVMVPRADIIAAKSSISFQGLIELVTTEGHSRVPLYVDTLDDAFAIVHVKDLLIWRGKEDAFDVSKIARTALFVSPSMHILELLLEMRVKRIHMAFVVDEYGGVDGLVTIEDLVEEIVGEIEDEFDTDEKPTFEKSSDGSWVASARTSLEDMAVVLGNDHFNGKDYADIDTLGGLVVSLAGHVPIRGELLVHDAGLEFEILDADPRRVKRVRVRINPMGSNPTHPQAGS